MGRSPSPNTLSGRVQLFSSVMRSASCFPALNLAPFLIIYLVIVINNVVLLRFIPGLARALDSLPKNVRFVTSLFTFLNTVVELHRSMSPLQLQLYCTTLQVF